MPSQALGTSKQVGFFQPSVHGEVQCEGMHHISVVVKTALTETYPDENRHIETRPRLFTSKIHLNKNYEYFSFQFQVCFFLCKAEIFISGKVSLNNFLLNFLSIPFVYFELATM